MNRAFLVGTLGSFFLSGAGIDVGGRKRGGGERRRAREEAVEKSSAQHSNIG
jgi:hypothetical protein